MRRGQVRPCRQPRASIVHDLILAHSITSLPPLSIGSHHRHTRLHQHPVLPPGSSAPLSFHVLVAYRSSLPMVDLPPQRAHLHHASPLPQRHRVPLLQPRHGHKDEVSKGSIERTTSGALTGGSPTEEDRSPMGPMSQIYRWGQPSSICRMSSPPPGGLRWPPHPQPPCSSNQGDSHLLEHVPDANDAF